MVHSLLHLRIRMRKEPWKSNKCYTCKIVLSVFYFFFFLSFSLFFSSFILVLSYTLPPISLSFARIEENISKIQQILRKSSFPAYLVDIYFPVNPLMLCFSFCAAAKRRAEEKENIWKLQCATKSLLSFQLPG